VETTHRCRNRVLEIKWACQSGEEKVSVGLYSDDTTEKKERLWEKGKKILPGNTT
jgi:hypothetical protein